MRALALHADVLVVTSAVLQVNCVIVRGGVDADGADEAGGPAAEGAGIVRVIEPGEAGRAGEAGRPGEAGEQPAGGGSETFVIDSPVLPDELDALPALLEQARFPSPSGLLVTHGDWDHLLGGLAFPGVALGCAQSTAERLQASPGEAQRALRAFDEELMIERRPPLALGSVQALPVPGHCALGDRELELHRADGHTPDGMAVAIPWAGVLVAGDYLSPVEIPMLNDGGAIEPYLETLERLRALVLRAEHVVPGHGSIMSSDTALAGLEEDVEYLRSLDEHGAEATLPASRSSPASRRVHTQNVAALGDTGSPR